MRGLLRLKGLEKRLTSIKFLETVQNGEGNFSLLYSLRMKITLPEWEFQLKRVQEMQS